MSKKLVAYFSASGVTAKAAKTLAEAAGADLYEIKPEVPYTSADLDWMNKKSRSTVEMEDETSRPAIADEAAEVEAYDVIFIAYPVWWYKEPSIIKTFAEAYDFSGKTIVLCATSGGSGLGQSAADLKDSMSETAVIKDGRMLNGRLSKGELTAWIEGLGL